MSCYTEELTVQLLTSVYILRKWLFSLGLAVFQEILPSFLWSGTTMVCLADWHIHGVVWIIAEHTSKLHGLD